MMTATVERLRLNIGCGDTRRAGYVGVDVRTCTGADYVCPAWDMSSFAPASVDEIYSRHMLEHLDPNDARRALLAWFDVLRPGGMLRLIVPDLAFHAQQLLGTAVNWVSDRAENERHAFAGFYGWRDEARGGNREDAHRWGYSEASLRELLVESGFERVQRVTVGDDTERWHLHVTAERPGTSPWRADDVRESKWHGDGSRTDSRMPRDVANTAEAARAGESVSFELAQAATQRVLADWRGRGSMVVLGAGAHTRKILPALLRHADRIAGIADDSPVTWGTQIGRWTVNPLSRILSDDVGGILISSDVQQRTLADRARREFGERCAILTLYSEAEAGGGPLLLSTGERQTGRSLEEIEIGHRARYHWAAGHLQEDARVLDAACGNGYGARILADAGARVLGVDVAPDAVAFARHYFNSDRTRFVAAAIDDGRSLRLATERRGPFDAVVSLETLEHLEHPESFLRDAASLLRPGGELFCSTPNAAVMDLDEAPFHRRHFTSEEVRHLLDACGFELLGWFGQEGMQILAERCTPRQRYCLYHARRR